MISQVSPKSAAVVAVTALGVSFAAWFVWKTTGALLVTAVALLLAVALNRFVEWLERHRFSRGAGIAVAMIAVVGLLVAFGFLFIPPVVSQIEQLSNEWPRLLASAQHTDFYRFLQQHLHLDRVEGLLEKHAGEAVGSALAAVQFIVEGIGAVVTVLFVTIFMLAVGRRLVLACLAQAKPDRRARYARVVSELYRALGGYVLGHLLIVGLQCAATTIVLAVAGVPFFLPLGLFSGLASLIPFAGVTIVGTAVSVIAWGTHGLVTGLIVAGYYILYQQFENHVLYPMVYRRTVEVNPLVIILAVLFLADWGGIPGAILAVPLTAAAHVVVGVILRVRRERLGIPPPPPAENARALQH
jgi:putative heme transporter